MDALKDIPDDVKELKTKIGSAYLQKTDIFKKMMWFSYRGSDNWVALPAIRVKEIIALNKNGEFPDDLSNVTVQPILVERILDYDNVVGQDSLTRMDERNKKKKKSNNNNRNKNRNKPQSASEGNASKPAGQTGTRNSSNSRPPHRAANNNRPPNNAADNSTNEKPKE
jgi:hypothetical protein